MVRNITDTNRRDAEILLAALNLIKDNGGSMKYAAIKEELPKYFKFTERELAPRNTWAVGWYTILGMIGGIELKQTGFVNITKSVWTLTEKGESVLSMSSEQFYKAYHFPYLDILKTKQQEKALKGEIQQQQHNQTEEEAVESAAEKDIETLKEKAREQIRQYIISKDPYEFQYMVAALFRAMGYFTPFVASKGKDGGIDVIAYRDPLGVIKPHIKAQIKHRPTTSLSVDIVRSVSGILRNADEIGFIITSGSFTSEAVREARNGHNHIRLIDMEEFIDLWTAYYANMPEEDKALLPITPIYYLNNSK